MADSRAFVEIVEAKRQGHKFIKVYLHRSKIGRGQKRIMISGAVTLVGYRVGMDDFGSGNFRFEERRGDSMVFEFDENEREYICWLYDDAGRGYFSPNGYNRDLLATHFDQEFFIIKDPEVYADVKLRYEHLQKNPPSEATTNHKAFTTNINSGMTLDEIDSQIEFLKQRKEQIIKIDSSGSIEEDQKTEAYDRLKKERTKKKPDLEAQLSKVD